MEQLPENKPDSIEELAEAATPSVGHLLRAGREQQGLSIEDVVAKIKLAPRQILALEADDFQALPETAFVRGFVRSYAKLLQLDVQPLLDALPGTVQAKAELVQVDAPFPSEKKGRQQNVNLLMAALFVAVLIAAFATWQARTPQVQVTEIASDIAASDVASTELALPEQTEILDLVPESGVIASAVPVVPVVTAPAPVPTAPVSTAPKSSAALRLVFDKESWAEIKDQSGKTLTKQVNQPGTELRVEGTAPFSLVIGHAAAVHLYYREKPVDLSAYINASSDVARMTLE